MIWYYRLKVLPDFLQDFTLAQEQSSDRFNEFWRRWTQLISSFWTPDCKVTYALEFSWQASKRRVVLSFLLGGSETDCDVAKKLVETGLSPFGLDGVWLNEAEKEIVLQAPARMKPFSAYEVCQQELITFVRYKLLDHSRFPPEAFVEQTPNDSSSANGGKDRQIINFNLWWGPGSSFLLPFHILAAQKQNVVLRVLLRPTTMAAKKVGGLLSTPQPFEELFLADMARQGESSSQPQTSHSSGAVENLMTSQSMTDPQLRDLAKIYSANLRRLKSPFLCAVHVYSPSDASALQVASAFAAGIREEVAFAPSAGETSPIPGGAQVIALCRELANATDELLSIRNSDHRSAVRMALKLDPEYFNQVGDSLFKRGTCPELARLRYLMDSRGAASAFRLPVPVRGGVPGFNVRQIAPEFHPGPQGQVDELDSLKNMDHPVLLGHLVRSKDPVSISLPDFTKHCLVTGFTGSGKTVTVYQLLHSLWIDNEVPFLVLESAKQEYRGLKDVLAYRDNPVKLRIYTVGNNNCVPLRFNPFQLLPGVRVEAHISRLQSCLEAALPIIGPSSSVIQESLVRVYRRCQWELSDLYPSSSDQPLPVRPFPTMARFLEEASKVIEDRNYGRELQQNLKAAILGRLKPLTLGSLGLMFESQVSQPPADVLFMQPTILELNDLNLNEKAIVTMFVVTLLREYRETNPFDPGILGHVTVVEEAHNVLENLQSQGGGEGGAADTRYQAVQSFSTLLAEIRSLGEGLVIADQSPEKLAPDAMRNTNLQISHQLRDSKDRAAIARAMIMDDEQREYLGKLQPGRAAVFMTGLEKATFMKVDEYYPSSGSKQSEFRGCGFNERVKDMDVAFHMDKIDIGVRSRRSIRPYSGCRECGAFETCQYREIAYSAMNNDSNRHGFGQVFILSAPKVQKARKISWDVYWQTVVTHCASALHRQNIPLEIDAAWCYFIQSYLNSYWIAKQMEMPPSNWTAARHKFKSAFDKCQTQGDSDRAQQIR